MRSVVILGSTGSIGENALKVAEALPDAVRVAGLATRSKVTRVIDQALQFGVEVVAVEDRAAAAEAAALARPHGIQVWAGAEGVAALAGLAAADTVLCALVGLAGLRPVLTALEAGKDVALATKEVLVSAGELVMRRRAEAGVSLLPVDSEHSALFQCLQSSAFSPACVRTRDGEPAAEDRVARLVLTASGGPFAARRGIDFERVTPEQALDHPRWAMGRKVTIDSATMMNKGLEIMEAQWLFNVPAERIGVAVHPESIVHSLVTFVDGTQLAQLSVPDMRFPIQYALTWPDRLAAALPSLDLVSQGRLTFEAPDESRFPCLRLAREAAAAGGTLPAVLNAADEVAVEAFLAGAIPFAGIWRTVEQVMAAHAPRPAATREAIVEADAWARVAASERCGMRGTNKV
ncbi:MAG TPA: 1-deoxy-D-xylulose-5-phosphate reductoisomerase [Kiritimatiellia bacterium]|jgi:1-deoxy-D-xylulose-5-phosphate reductoisomerase|nr:1-deoxy-D-xylulose-5-phosphate reductoisomerase [Kiritimatiellia bacterium]OQC33224.1 MAG: 1-deoxy-D-xylulose 5-phosphate reductoisomerase [Verrucomicrobia bacterium ADurb.Bin070]HPB10002.1 1-deoxy-D-xylulose-5-phosphate reductoisomerase [Kiritimatiellia bacterium]HPO37206.1 1-deoxy-D-xylulose-5-phosphate reductoisomerase [Kiritimatiellia bacterium]HQQ91341.1 1-deoxy-D-xylulose-5-phosphate reductoisomerase [Kiritimatiellia bacterium]